MFNRKSVLMVCGAILGLAVAVSARGAARKDLLTLRSGRRCPTSRFRQERMSITWRQR